MRDLSHQTVRRLFDYDPQGFLRWKESPAVAVPKGSVAGTVQPRGYVRIAVNGKQYAAPRLVWIYHHGAIPKGMQIKHLNHVRGDNRIENLQPVTLSENLLNKRLYANSKTGVPGVTFRSDTKNLRVRISHNGRRITIGNFESKEEAIAARKR